MRTLLVVTLWCLAVPCAAQTITSYPLRIYNVGATSPLSTTDLLAANVVCNQTAPSSTSPVNPMRAIWDDPDNAGKVCIWTDPGTGPLASLPFGATSYEATLAATNAAGTSPESNRAPFSRPGVIPVARTGLKLAR